MLEVFTSPFFIKATIICFFLGIIFGIFSIFVVLRKLSFLGVGIAHSAFAGVALAILLGTNIFFTTFIFCLIVSFFISRVSKLGKVEYDSSIGLFFSLTMAIGIILLSLNQNYNFDLMGYLFGSVLGITVKDIIFTGIFTFLSVCIQFIFFKELIFITFDPEVAKASGLNINFFDNLLLILLTIIIIISIKLIGIILVAGFLILPGIFSLKVTRNYKKSFIISIVFCWFCFFLGLTLSYYYDFPPGGVIMILGSILYFLVLFIDQAINHN